MKRKILAAALSAILPGAGQLYNRKWLKGAGFLIAVMIISGVIRRRLLFEGPSQMTLLVTVLIFGIVLWSVADAYRDAQRDS